jgi:hypothetical protein
MSGNQSNKRSFIRKFVIYPKFQFQLIGFINLIMIIGFSVVTIQIHRSFNQLRELGEKANYPTDHIFFRFMDQQFDDYILPYMIVGFLFALIITNLGALWISQRLAGPIVRLNSYFDEVIVKKDVLPLTFRSNDFFTELPPKIVTALKTFKSE